MEGEVYEHLLDQLNTLKSQASVRLRQYTGKIKFSLQIYEPLYKNRV